MENPLKYLHLPTEYDMEYTGSKLKKYPNILFAINLNQELIKCQITDLHSDISSQPNKCLHAPFKGSSINDFGDYISRYFYVFTDIEYDANLIIIPCMIYNHHSMYDVNLIYLIYIFVMNIFLNNLNILMV